MAHIEFSEKLDTHFTDWEIKNYLRKNYKNCDQDAKSTFEDLTFHPYSDKRNSDRSVLLVRNHVARKSGEIGGMYLKILRPEKGKYLVPDARGAKAKTLTSDLNSHIRTDHEKTCSEMNQTTRSFLYEESGSRFASLKLQDLKFPLFNIAEWAQTVPGYSAYVNTSWFNVEHGGPHDVPCTSIFGTTISRGEVITGPVSNSPEALGLFAIMKTGEVQIMNPEDRIRLLPQIEHGFSGVVAQKDFVESKLSPVSIMFPKFSTIRTAFVIDGDGNLIIFSQTTYSDVPRLVSFLKEKLFAKDILIADGGGSRTLLVNRVGNLDLPDLNDWIYVKPTDRQGMRPVPSILAISTDEQLIENGIGSIKVVESKFGKAK